MPRGKAGVPPAVRVPARRARAPGRAESPVRRSPVVPDPAGQADPRMAPRSRVPGRAASPERRGPRPASAALRVRSPPSAPCTKFPAGASRRRKDNIQHAALARTPSRPGAVGPTASRSARIRARPGQTGYGGKRLSWSPHLRAHAARPTPTPPPARRPAGTMVRLYGTSLLFSVVLYRGSTVYPPHPSPYHPRSRECRGGNADRAPEVVQATNNRKKRPIGRCASGRVS